jgi:hypothetical protein
MNIRASVTSVLAVGFVLSVAPSSFAATAVAGVEPTPPDATGQEESGGARTHDGFYMHAGAGLGYYSLSSSGGVYDEELSGLTKSFAFLIGGSVIPGLAVGGGFTLDHASSPTYTIDGQELELADVSQMLLSIGPFVDFYPDPQGGLHFQGMVGWGGVETSSSGNVGGSDPTGVVFTLGGGYNFFFADEWSVGALARLSYASLSLNDTSYSALSPALLVDVTFQ